MTLVCDSGQNGCRRDNLSDAHYGRRVVTVELTPVGRLVFVEYKAEDIRVPIKPLHKMSEAQIKREAGIFVLDWERTVSTLPWQHVVIFRKRE